MKKVTWFTVYFMTVLFLLILIDGMIGRTIISILFGTPFVMNLYESINKKEVLK